MGKLIRNGIEYGGGNGTDIFEVTQAEYNALKTAGTLVHNALYVISDADNLNATAQNLSYNGGVGSTYDEVEKKANTASLASVATSGDYNDLINRVVRNGGLITDLNNTSRLESSVTAYLYNGGATNSPSGTAGGWLISFLNSGTSSYGSQIVFSNGGMYWRKLVGGNFTAWSTIAS